MGCCGGVGVVGAWVGLVVGGSAACGGVSCFYSGEWVGVAGGGESLL